MSRSGAIRRQLGLIKHHITNKTVAAQQAYDDSPSSGDAADTLAYLESLHDVQTSLVQGLDRLNAKHQDWLSLLQDNSDPDALDREQHLYDDACEDLLTLIFETEELIARLDRRIRRFSQPPPAPSSISSVVQMPVLPLSNSASQPPPPAASATHPAPVAPNPAVNVPPAAIQQHRYMSIKPPKMSLPRFGGNCLEWKQFWGIFKANIHDRPDILNIEKFTFLIGQLDGDAKRAIAGLTIEDHNYDVAVSLLQRRFDRADDRIISMLYSELKKIPSAARSTTSQQTTMDECERVFRQLESSGEDVNSNRSLTIELLSKFPATMIRDLQRHSHVGPNSALKDVRSAISQWLAESEASESIIEDLQAMKLAPQREHNPGVHARPTPDFRTSNERVFENSALASVQTAAGPRRPQMLSPPSNCYFCEGPHFNCDCTAYSSAEERQKRLADLNRCTRCMRIHAWPFPGHRCTSSVRCVHCKTNESHTTALCYNRFPSRVPATGRSQREQPGDSFRRSSSNATASPTNGDRLVDTDAGGITALNSASKKAALFQTAKTTLVNPYTGDTCVVRLAMDTLSSRSYVTDAVAQKLNLFGPRDTPLFVSVFGTSKTLEIPTRQVDFDIMLRDGSKVECSANTTKVICRSSALPSGWTNEETKVLQSFKSSLADDPFDDNGTIDVLLGASLVWEFIEGSRIATASPHMFLIPSKFGLLLAGQSGYEEDSQPTLLYLTESPCRFPSELGLVSCETKLEASYPDVDEFWALDKIGITDDPAFNEDDKAFEVFTESIRYVNGRYEVKWPWVPENRDLLPSNYAMAYNRFRSLSKRLKTNDALMQGYRDVIKTQLHRNIIEKVPDEEIESDNLTHYLPHHPVVKESSATTKLRIVYDAGSKPDKHSVSLNESMMRGPVILPDLCHMLLQMRVHEIVVIADIEKAFLQISLHPSERDVVRFLWFKDDSTTDLSNNIGVYRFCRIPFGIKCCPFLLAGTIHKHLTQEGTTFSESLLDKYFADNVFQGMNDDRTIEYYHDLKALFARAGMNIQEFCSNSPRLMEFLPPEDAVKNTDTKVLGLKWDSQGDDTLRLMSSSLDHRDAAKVTKRTVLRNIASVFDPLGFFQPVTFFAKNVLKQLWEKGLDWDDAVTDECLREWNEVRADLELIQSHRIPRFVGKIDGEFTLAVFSDASGKAYATAVYLRVKCSNDQWQSNLIFSKSRLSPKAKSKSTTEEKECQGITLPRLELLGVVIGVRAAQFCRAGLKSPNVQIDLFCDSECVHHWIRSRSILKPFVKKRVDEIRNATHVQFHFVPTHDNPADFATRGKSATDLATCDMWWKGPTWLTLNDDHWPRHNMDPVDDETLRSIQSEIKPAYVNHTLVAAEPPDAKPTFLTVNPATISTLNKLIRVSVICLKFLKKTVWTKLSLATRARSKDLSALFSRISDDTTLTHQDMQTARRCWIRNVQTNHFSHIQQDLTTETKRPTAMISQLGLRFDNESLLRTHGRMENADLSASAMNPLLLPANDPLTTLIVQDVHTRIMHSGVSHTLSSIRDEYWILHGRSVVRRILRKCLVCRIFKTAKPFKLPPMPPLPGVRVAPANPFQHTGLDYFGPITVEAQHTRIKMWVCLYTCMVTRAVHLEPVMDCSAPEFLHCLIRFVSRRGVPRTITSDNAAQFRLVQILGDVAWKRTPTDPNITSYCAEQGIQWKYITELAPWQGGFYERLVGLVKSTLRTSIKRKTLTWTNLVTMLAEAEAVVNSRPITYVNDDVNSRFRILRPMDFLLSSANAVDSDTDVDVSSQTEAGKRLAALWEHRRNTLNELWQHWYDEYLLSLRERRITSHKSGRSDSSLRPLLHQVVLVYEPNLPRGRWKTARITQLLTSSDGKVRSAEVVLASGHRIKRPINLLIPIEIGPMSTEQSPHDEDLPSASHPDPVSLDNATPTTDVDEDDDFLGFTQADIARTERALAFRFISIIKSLTS